MELRELTAKAVFDQAHEIASAGERVAFLDRICAGMPELRGKVDALFRAYDAAGSFMARPASPLPLTGSYQASDSHVDVGDAETVPPRRAGGEKKPVVSAEGVGSWIGPYRLVQELGEGGMGAVYLAEQEQPIQRQVALKLIKPGMDSAPIIARFEAERQALTMMEHPNIAKVLDAGATENGRPYFVMELVKGVPLTRFCNENGLSIHERLELFVTICRAVQHAHQKGIMHRDLKPGNVLASMQDGTPLAKVIDFGLAKAIEQPLTDQSRLTQAGAIVGTLKYMSPEQADFNTEGIDTRTDIYSLGVILYELLTGTTPLDVGKRGDLHGQGFIDMVLRIKEEEPPKPSSRISTMGEKLSTIAAERKAEPAKLAKLVRGELDWIVMKALEKDRNRRYETASDLAKDVEHFLQDEPVDACPPSARYRLGKFARKHRTLLATAGGFVALLLLGVIGLTYGLIVVNNLRHQAVRAEDGMREGYDLSQMAVVTAMRSGVKLKDLDKSQLKRRLDSQSALLQHAGHSPQERATSSGRQFLIGNLYVLIGDPAVAESHYAEAARQYQKLVDEFPESTTYRNDLARLYFNQGFLLNELKRLPEAEAAYRRAIVMHEKLAAEHPNELTYRVDLADEYNNLGAVYRDRQELFDAEKTFRKAIDLGEQLRREDPDFIDYQVNLAASLHNLGNVVREQLKPTQSLEFYARAIALLSPIKNRPASGTTFLRNAHWDRANALGQLDRHQDAIHDWQTAIELDDGGARESLRLFLAATELEIKLAAANPVPGQLCYDAARINARAAKAASDLEEKSLGQRLALRALGLLNQAKTAGWFNEPRRIKELKENPDFQSLPAVEFQKFFDSLK